MVNTVSTTNFTYSLTPAGRKELLSINRGTQGNYGYKARTASYRAAKDALGAVLSGVANFQAANPGSFPTKMGAVRAAKRIIPHEADKHVGKAFDYALQQKYISRWGITKRGRPKTGTKRIIKPGEEILSRVRIGTGKRGRPKIAVNQPRGGTLVERLRGY